MYNMREIQSEMIKDDMGREQIDRVLFIEAR